MAPGEIGFVGLGKHGPADGDEPREVGTGCRGARRGGHPARAPKGAKLAASTASLAGRVETIHLCVPDGRASESIAREIAGASDRRNRLVVDHSTIGTEAAVRVHALLSGNGIEYVDAPVSRRGERRRQRDPRDHVLGFAGNVREAAARVRSDGR